MPGMLVRSFRCTQSSYDRSARLGGTQCTPSLPRSPPSALNRAPRHCTNRRIPTQKATERRCAMKAWLQHTALSAVVLAVLPLIELASPAVSRAQPPPPPCPPGMYWNFATVRCEFPLPPPVYIDPWLPVYVPDIIDADLDLDVDIPIPGPPGIGAPGRPGGIGPGGPGPRGGGGGRRGGGRR